MESFINHLNAFVLAAATFGAASAGAVNPNQSADPNLQALNRDQVQMAALHCPACRTQAARTKNLLLQPIYYFRDLRTIMTRPRTREAVGDLAAIGMLKNRGGEATAFLVSPCHVLTSYHVAFTSDPRHPSAHNVSRFYFGQGHDDSFQDHVNAVPVAWGNWQGSMEDGKGTPTDDWALLRLDKCVGKDLGYLDLAGYSDSTLFGLNKNMAGILKWDYSQGLNIDLNCVIEGYRLLRGNIWDETVFIHRCATLPGSSGAPLYTNVFGFPQVFAINSGATKGDTGEERVERHWAKMNEATTIKSIEDPLARALMSPEAVDYIEQQTGEQNWQINGRHSKELENMAKSIGGK